MARETQLQRISRNLAFLALSIAVHILAVLLITLLGYLTEPLLPRYDFGPEIPVHAPLRITELEVELQDAAFVEVDDRDTPVNLQRLLDEATKELEGMSRAEKMKRLRKRLGRLRKIPRSHVDEIASAVEKFKNVPENRAFRPRPGAEGNFHAASGSLYDIRRLTGDDGKTRYALLLVDRAGRTMVQTLKEEEMTPEFRTAYRVFRMGRRNPALRRLIDTARKWEEGLGADMETGTSQNPNPRPPENRDGAGPRKPGSANPHPKRRNDDE